VAPSLFDSTCYSNDDSASSHSSAAFSLHSSLAPRSSDTPPTARVLSNIRFLVINFQSILSKKAELAYVIDMIKPGIIIGCETWLKPLINKGEFLPDDYVVYRKNRPDGYGGVLLGIHSSLNSHEITVASDAEVVAAKILSGKQSIVVGFFYRPPSNDQANMDRLTEAITCLRKSEPKEAYWIAGDANLPDIDWSIDQVTRHQYNLHISDSFLQTLAKTGLEQTVDFPTRYDNTLDIVLTNRPSLVSRCEGAPGLSDRDIVLLDVNSQANRTEPVQRKIHLWKRADLDALVAVQSSGQKTTLTSSLPPQMLTY